jgi:hypothetical protein
MEDSKMKVPSTSPVSSTSLAEDAPNDTME